MAGTKLEKAYLVLVDPPTPATKPPKLSSVLGEAKSGGKGEVVFTFNPKEFTIKKSAQWKRDAQKAAQTTAMPEFMGANAASLSLEVFLDATEADRPSVAGEVQRLLDAATPLKSSVSAEKPSPPWVVFGWGKFLSFVAVVTSVSAKYTLFAPDGTPLRAVCTIELQEVPTDPPPRQNPTSGALQPQRTHRTVAGDTLQSIAQLEYTDPALWRALAIANDIDDPLRLSPGLDLLVPARSQAALHA